MTDKLLIDVARLDKEGERLQGELDCAVLDLHEEYLRPFAGLRYDLTANLFGRELVVRGKLEQDFDAACSRCGADFDFTVKVPDFTASVETDENAQFADLTDELRQSILLGLPTYPVCREDCQGVCPTCGKNLNDGSCSCRSESHDGRWAALDAVQLG